MFPAHGILPLLGAAASAVLAVVVHSSAPDKRLGRMFSFLAFSLVCWNLNIFALYAFADYADALWYSRLFRTGSLFLFPAILHLSLVLPGRPISRGWAAFLIVDYALSAYLAAYNLAGQLVTQLAVFQWGYYSVGSRLYDVFTVSLVVNFVAAASLLIREYATTNQPRMRLQLKFWLVGMAIALPLGLTNLLPAYGLRLYPLGNLGSALWASIVGYAIVRHRLMDIEIVVARGLAYVGVTLAIIGPVGVTSIALQYWAFGEVHYDFSTAIVVLFVFVAVLFPRLQVAAERRVGRSLFRTKFESHEALVGVASEVVRILDREKLLRFVCDRVGDAVGSSRVSIYLPDDLGRLFQLGANAGGPTDNPSLSVEHPVVRWVGQIGEAILAEELEGRAGGGGAFGWLVENGWAVVVPFKAGRDLVGFMCLGAKTGLEAYTVGDIRHLNQVAAETAIALQNARLYEELRRSRAIISRTGRLSAIGNLAAGIAHEIRNPLVSIQTFFQLAPDRLDDEEFMTSFLKLAEAEVRRISDLISELLTFAKSPTPMLREIDLREVVERASVLLEPQARSQGVKLVLRNDTSHQYVLADADQVMQVVLNIGLNAVQATSKGGEIALETRRELEQGRTYCQIEIRDSGIGISEALREAIFDPFFTTKEKGTGLGLAIAQQIVMETGGFIRVDSQEGQGSRFLIYLPIAGQGGAAAVVDVCHSTQDVGTVGS